jgi:hypothetical protein
VATGLDSPLAKDRPHQDNTVITVARPGATYYVRDFWPLSLVYDESALSKKLQDGLRNQGVLGNLADVMAAHQVYAAIQIAAGAWNEKPGRDRTQFTDLLRRKREVDTVLGKISFTDAGMFCPTCTGNGGCTSPKEPCKDDKTKCCEKK